MLTEQTEGQTDRQTGSQRDTLSGSQTDGRHIKAALLAGQQAELDDSHCGLDDNRRGCLVLSLSRSLRCCSLYGKNATIPVLPTHVEGAGEREVESGEWGGRRTTTTQLVCSVAVCCVAGSSRPVQLQLQLHFSRSFLCQGYHQFVRQFVTLRWQP